MPVSSAEIMDVAKLLIADAGEARARASMGRSYYAAYHEARAAVDKLSLPPSKPTGTGSHERLISSFEGKGKGLSKVAARLRLRKLARHKADYDINESVTNDEATLHLQHCQHLIEDLQRLSSAHSR